MVVIIKGERFHIKVSYGRLGYCITAEEESNTGWGDSFDPALTDFVDRNGGQDENM